MTDNNRISLAEVKKLLRQMIQMAAFQKEAEELEQQQSPCPQWLARRNACSQLAAAHSLNSLPASPMHFVPNDNVNLNKESDPAAAAGSERPVPLMRVGESVQPEEQMSRQQEAIPSLRSEQPFQSPVMPIREPRIFPRFLGKTILNRPIRVEVSRGPSSGKRALDCIRRCIIQGGLHPVQCHSIC